MINSSSFLFLNYFVSFLNIVATIPQSIPPIGKTTQQICHQFNVNPNVKKIAVAISIITPQTFPTLSDSAFASSVFCLLYA
jgi:hypothetical protein